MAPFQKFALSRLNLSFAQRRRILREVRRWEATDKATRETFRARLRGWRSQLVFVVITNALERPAFMIAGPLMAALLYAVGMGFVVFNLFKG